jgi:hypothetical protein
MMALYPLSGIRRRSQFFVFETVRNGERRLQLMMRRREKGTRSKVVFEMQEPNPL